MSHVYDQDEILDFWLDYFAESYGVDPDDVYVTDDLEQAWATFENAVQDALNECLDPEDVDLLYDTYTPAEIAHEVYLALGGHGTDFRDKWGFLLGEPSMEPLYACLARDRRLGRMADITGGGSLNDAFTRAVLEA